jgi:heteromeric Ino2p/Ino4p transcription factor
MQIPHRPKHPLKKSASVELAGSPPTATSDQPTMASPSPTPSANNPPLLTTAQKKENHIQSEKKRREAIRYEFEGLTYVVPGIIGMGRSELVVMETTLKYMREMITKRQDLLLEAERFGIDTRGYELPTETVKACEEHLKRVQVESPGQPQAKKRRSK